MIYKHKLKKIKKGFLGKRAFGCPESVMRILSMWLMKKSRKVVTVNCDMKENRVSLSKTQEQLSKMDDDETNVFATSVIDRYAARPNDLKEMCLASFAVNYDVLLPTDDCHFNDDMQRLTNDSIQKSTHNFSKKFSYVDG